MANDSSALEKGSGIDLAHEPSFRLGTIAVQPRLRQLIRGTDGAEEIVEPRVMQVLVALARARGGIATRDELVRDCWEGRFVSDDAINRALSRVRRLAEGIGAGVFALETVTKVGYRLVAAGGESPLESAGPATPAGSSRRLMLASGVAAATLAALGGWAILHRSAEPRLAPGTDALMQQALVALSQDTREGHNQAIGLYRRVVDANPDYADGWGALGNAYSLAAVYRLHDESESLRLRARAAARRALSIDPGNGFAQVAFATSWPMRGNWLPIERALRRAIDQDPANEQMLFALVALLMAVGRISEALPLIERIEKLVVPVPDIFFYHINMLWDLDRLEEADRLMNQAASIYPTHFAIWFTRFYVLMYSGRASAAIAMAEDRQTRPTGIRQSEIESVVRAARAIESRDPGLIDRAVAEQLDRAHQGSGYAENSIQFASAAGRLDTAFAIANAYYFGRGFTVPDMRFTPEQGTYSAIGDRLTGLLFKPTTRAMRSDRRFPALVREIGLEDYWRHSSSRPDYRA